MLLSLILAFCSIYFVLLLALDTSAELVLSDYAFSSLAREEINPDIAIGLYFGSIVEKSLHMITATGYVVGESYISSNERGFTPLYSIEQTDIVAAVDDNLAVGYNSVTVAATPEETTLGGYHVEMTTPEGVDAWSALADLRATLEPKYTHCFPAYIAGVRTVRVGAFATYDEAETAMVAISADPLYTGYTFSLAAPSSTGVSFLNETADIIYFEYSSDDKTKHLGCMAVQANSDQRAYICDTNYSLLYDGAFCFRRYMSDSYDGLNVINLVDMNTYIEGVLPNEIYPSWKEEVIKAFAITTRSYAVTNFGKHFGAYGFDLCDSSHCQNYRGRRNVNEKIISAANSSSGQVLVCDGKMVTSYYSARQGGASASTQVAWGGYAGREFISQFTPWEKYAENDLVGLWEVEYTQSEMIELLKNKGFDVKGTRIVSIETEVPEDTLYVYRISFTDDTGTTYTVQKSDSIRVFLKTDSANFEIGIGSVNRMYDEVLSTKIIEIGSEYAGNLYVHTASGVVKSDSTLFNFFTKLGNAIKDNSSAMFVHTSGGVATVFSDSNIPMSTDPDENGLHTKVANYNSFLIISELRRVNTTLTAAASDNIIISGRGRGHGVGMGAWGARDLANAGATAEQILYAYYPGSEIIPASEFYKTGE